MTYDSEMKPNKSFQTQLTLPNSCCRFVSVAHPVSKRALSVCVRICRQRQIQKKTFLNFDKNPHACTELMSNFKTFLNFWN